MYTYYRADKRDFEINEEIKTADEFSKLNPQGSEIVEQIFEEERPKDKPKRVGALYLFIDETAAKKHWSKMTNGKLYTVEPTLNGNYHVGDMCHVDSAFLKKDNTDAVRNFASMYWKGEHSSNPILEVLIDSAIIKSVISKDENERIAYFKNWAIHRDNINYTSPFI